MNKLFYAFDKSIYYEVYPKDLNDDYDLIVSAIYSICKTRNLILADYRIDSIIQAIYRSGAVVLFMDGTWIKLCTADYLNNYGSFVSWI